jgi:hypothetical protein
VITEDFAGYAARVRLVFPDRIPPEDMQRMLEHFMNGLAMDCLEAGTRLIGHIKSVVENGDTLVACSVTDHDGKVRCRGRFETPQNKVDIIVNVMQYGLNKKDLALIVAECGRRSFPGHEDLSIEDLEIEKKDLIQLS